MTKKKLVLKKKPAKPEKKTEEHYISLCVGVSVQDILERVHKLGVPTSEVILKREKYYDGYEWAYKTPEDAALFQVRMDKYERDLKRYVQWQEDYKEEIAIRLQEDKVKKAKQLKESLDNFDKKKAKTDREVSKARIKIMKQLTALEEDND